MGGMNQTLTNKRRRKPYPGMEYQRIHEQHLEECTPRRWMRRIGLEEMLIGVGLHDIVSRSPPLGPSGPAFYCSFKRLEEIPTTLRIFRNPELLEDLERV